MKAVVLELGRRGWVLRLNAGKILIGKGTPHERIISGVEAGTPDLLVLLDGGRTVWVELKAPGKKPTALQAGWHARARKLGHQVAVCYSVTEVLVAVRNALAGR